MITPVEKALLAVMIFVIMLGMGATLDWGKFKSVLKTPKAFLIGILSQFGWMPVIGYLLAVGLNLPTEFAIGIILVGCTPGGTTSNLFSYFSRGDVALSISMTVCSTVFAVFMMPILLAVYSKSFTQGTEFIIPYANIVSTLVIVLLPVSIGLFIRKRSLKAALRVEKTGSIFGVLVILFLLGTWIPKNSHFLFETSLSVYLGALGLSVIGFGLGYVVSVLVKLSPKQARTVSLETGIQNTPLTFAIILSSFPPDLASKILWLPLIYAPGVVLTSCVATLVFRRVHV